MADHEPRHKRGKMDASTSQSSEVPKETQVPSAAEFLVPQIYAEIEAGMNVPTIYYKPICLLGSKGVGKTTLLYQLYETYKKEKKGSLYYDFSEVSWVIFEQKVTKLREDSKSGDYQWLFIDNVQLAKGHEYAEVIIRTYVKQQNHYTNLRVVAASSRAGLVFLMGEPIKLNSDDFHIMVVNPQKDIARQKTENVLSGMYKDNKETVEEWLQYTGFRLGEVAHLGKWMRFTNTKEEFSARLSKFKRAREASFRTALAADRKSFPEDTKDIFVKCVTLCIAGSGVSLEYLSTVYKLAPEELPWTLLKMTSDDKIVVVSAQAQFVISEFARTDASLLAEVRNLANAIGPHNLGSWLGSLFEQRVLYGLCSSSPLKTTKYKSEEETVKFNCCISKLISQKKLGKFKPEINCIYSTPNMEGADIIANVNGQTYFIQCSVAKEITVKKGFWKTAPDEWKPVLLVPKIDAVKNSLEEGSSDLASEYKQNKFALADARGILDERTIDEIMAKKEDV